MKNSNDRKSRLSLFFPQQNKKKKCVTKNIFAKKCVYILAATCSTLLVLLVNGIPIVL